MKGGVPGSFITCHNLAAGFGENPVGGGAALGKDGNVQHLQMRIGKKRPFGTSTEVLAETLPWPAVLEEVAGVIRLRSRGIEVFVECVLGGKVEGGAKFVTNPATVCCKAQTPATRKGTSALHPGFYEFGVGCGELEVEKSSETVTGKTEGEVKSIGYEEQELLNTKNP